MKGSYVFNNNTVINHINAFANGYNNLNMNLNWKKIDEKDYSDEIIDILINKDYFLLKKV
jgi:hypothetical protein